MRTAALYLLFFTAADAQSIVERIWIKSPRLSAAAQSMAPDVHEVRVSEQAVMVRSAGLSLQSFGPLQIGPIDESKATRAFEYIIPRRPQPGPSALPVGVIGTFINGMPIYNLASARSYQDQNLWHFDVMGKTTLNPPLFQQLMSRNTEHSPLIGYALDGYPIYGPFGFDAHRNMVRLRSSYRLRSITKRDRLPGGIALNPAQEGPAVTKEAPLGTFAEDYECVEGSGDLDCHNGRLAVTPEYPQGTYAYFLATDARGDIAYPYLIGTSYAGTYAPGGLPAGHRAVHQDGIDIYINSLPASSPNSKAVALVFQAPLERVHEKPVHLLIASDDLSRLEHVHPEAVTANTLQLTHTFAQPGRYWLYADYTPAGGTQTIARFPITIAGAAPARVPLIESRAMTTGGITATLDIDGPLETNRDLPFRFRLAEAATGNEVHDLQPYLGAWAHIVMLSADTVDFIHAHPQTAGPHTHAVVGESPTVIETTSGFKRAGRYKVWLQVQRAGLVHTFAFVVTVTNGPKTVISQDIPAGAIRIRVDAQGYHPARVHVPAGEPVTLAFERNDAQNCGGRIVFPELHIEKWLPPGAVTVVTIPAQHEQELAFGCGMGMMRGAVVVTATR